MARLLSKIQRDCVTFMAISVIYHFTDMLFASVSLSAQVVRNKRLDDWLHIEWVGTPFMITMIAGSNLTMVKLMSLGKALNAIFLPGCRLAVPMHCASSTSSLMQM